jgi:hemolysin activation/secretion protein
MNSLVLGWHYLSTRAYVYSISPEDGVDVAVKIEKASNDLASNYSFHTLSGNLRNYFRTPLKHHILASSLNGFYTKGEQLEQSNFTWRYLSVRGYPSTALFGNKGAALSLEYRYPLWYLEKGLLYGYTFFDRVWGDLFFDTGAATFGPVDQLGFKRGIGTELNLDTSALWLSYFVTLKLGYAKGLDAGGEEKFYFTLTL